MPVSALHPQSLSLLRALHYLSFRVSAWNLACSPLPQLPLSPVAIPSSVSGLPWWLSGKKSACERRRRGFNPWIGKIPSRRKWQPTPVILPGKSHGQRSLACYSPWGLKESDTPSTHTLLLLDQGFSRHQIRSLEFTLCTASSVSSPPPSAAQL